MSSSIRSRRVATSGRAATSPRTRAESAAQPARQRAQTAGGEGEEEQGDGEAEPDQPQALPLPEVRLQRRQLEHAGGRQGELAEAAVEVLPLLLAHLLAGQQEADLDRHHEPPRLAGDPRVDRPLPSGRARRRG